jgi:hypothetical protein
MGCSTRKISTGATDIAPRPAWRLALATAGIAAVAVVAGAATALATEDQASPADVVAAAVDTARSSLPAGAIDVHGDSGGELLSVDLLGDGSAEVMLYDYAANLTHELTVRSGEVLDDRAGRVQPPPSHDEAISAFGIALERPDPLPFASAFAQRQGVPLVSPDQVSVVAGAWTGDDSRAATDCGRHRCVQLVVATPAGDYLDTNGFVVDLSAGRVLELRASR